MAILCDNISLLFIMVPGTGCSVAGKTLSEAYSGRQLGRKHDSLDSLGNQRLISEEDRHRLTVCATVRNPFDKFVTYYQRLVGEWTETARKFQERSLERKRLHLEQHEYEEAKKRMEKSWQKRQFRRRLLRISGFNLWVLATTGRTLLRAGLRSGEKSDQERFDFLFPMLSGIDHVIRYEFLEDGLNSVIASCGGQMSLSIPRKNVTPKKGDYREYYWPITAFIIERLFAKILAVMDYEFMGPKGTESVIDLRMHKYASWS